MKMRLGFTLVIVLGFATAALATVTTVKIQGDSASTIYDRLAKLTKPVCQNSACQVSVEQLTCNTFSIANTDTTSCNVGQTVNGKIVMTTIMGSAADDLMQALTDAKLIKCTSSPYGNACMAWAAPITCQRSGGWFNREDTCVATIKNGN